MSTEVIISNGKITATISTLGAELIGLKSEGQELIWQADPNVWAKHAPMLFPICGGLKDNKFIYEGTEYNLIKHGYALHSEFVVENQSESSVCMLHTSTPQTKKVFPFDYELRVIFTLEKNALKIDYDVKNTGNAPMYFSIGAHEGYSCPEGLEEYSICFDKTEEFAATPVSGPLLKHEEKPVAPAGNELVLKNKYFEIDALVFRNINSRKASLKHNKSGKIVLSVDFNGFDYLLIWTKPGAKYVCIEPWCGIPDYVDSDYDITKKQGIIKLDEGKSTCRTHTIKAFE